jgi:hypothetical protein
MEGMTLNGTVHPHGLHTTYFFEFGPTPAHGAQTEATPLPPRLAAFYREGWDENTGGWYSGLGRAGQGLRHLAGGGAQGGFVRFTEPSGNDPNHDDGIGTLHLAKYVMTGPWGPIAGKPGLFLAAGDPDLRDARVIVQVRGNDWVANGSELQWWTQSQSNIELLNRSGWRHANWAYTALSLSDQLRSGKWEKVDYRLRNDSEAWTYAGSNPNTKVVYTYWPINDAQAHVNLDFFHMLTFIDPANPPRGSIDFDEFELAYRNHSLLLPSNGGRLVRAPKSTDDAATLTDGWRHGPGHVWRSAANPPSPLEFVWSFRDPVTLRALQLHQNPEWPAREVEALVSTDDRDYSSLEKTVLPEKGVPNANFAFTLKTGLSARARFLKVRITSGYRKEHWGLGEVEVFGTGATMLPDDDLYHVNQDVRGLKGGTTYHYRLVARNSAGTVRGEDRTFTVPAVQKPLVATGPASRVTAGTAKVEGRLNALGLQTQFYFEYGPDQNYGSKSPAAYGGLQITPRLVFANLAGLKPGMTYHYRLVATNEKGKSLGEAMTFTTGDR